MQKTAAGLFIVTLVILLIVAVFVVRTIRKPQIPVSSSSQQLKVAATIHPLADMVSQIGGANINVTTILPPSASPHTFESTPEQIRATQNVKLIFTIGHGLDDWAKSIADNAAGATVIPVDHNIQLRNLPLDQRDIDDPDQAVDPHYWLDVANAKIISRNIAEALSQTDPTHRDVYVTNLAAYIQQLDQLDVYVKQKLGDLTRHELITHHNAWGYFSDAYGLKVVGTFEISPGQEPTPHQIADLQARVKQYNVKTIFSEPQLSDQSLKPFTQDLNLKIAVLDPEGGLANLGYIAMMRYNAETIAHALK